MHVGYNVLAHANRQKQCAKRKENRLQDVVALKMVCSRFFLKGLLYFKFLSQSHVTSSLATCVDWYNSCNCAFVGVEHLNNSLNQKFIFIIKELQAL